MVYSKSASKMKKEVADREAQVKAAEALGETRKGEAGSGGQEQNRQS